MGMSGSKDMRRTDQLVDVKCLCMCAFNILLDLGCSLSTDGDFIEERYVQFTLSPSINHVRTISYFKNKHSVELTVGCFDMCLFIHPPLVSASYR